MYFIYIHTRAHACIQADMYICICTWYVRIHIYMHIHMDMNTHTYSHVHAYSRIHTFIRVCMYIYIYIYVYTYIAYMHVCLYVCICIYMYTYMCLYIWTHVLTANTLQHTSTHCNTPQHTATHCNTLQHTATHCNTPHHTHMNSRRDGEAIRIQPFFFGTKFLQLILFFNIQKREDRVTIKRPFHVCVMAHSFVQLISDMPHSYVCHDSFIWVYCFIRTCAITSIYIWHDSFICITWLIDICGIRLMYLLCIVTRSSGTPLTDSLIPIE